MKVFQENNERRWKLASINDEKIFYCSLNFETMAGRMSANLFINHSALSYFEQLAHLVDFGDVRQNTK
jgi:hypothetical protein